MEDKIWLFATSVIMGHSIARVSNSALLVLGGVSNINIDSLDQSEVLDSFEIFGCSRPSLPNYPIAVFGANIVWLDREQEEGLLVCGGADWKMVYRTCFRWSPM